MTRHVVLLGAPRSGAGVVVRELAGGRGWSQTGLSHIRLLDTVAGCTLADHDHASHRLTAADVTDEVREVITSAAKGPEVSVDWNPAWSLRLGLLTEVLPAPDTRFVLVVRSPLPTVGSMVNAWRSHRFVTAPSLPAWWGDPWSFPVVPEWRAVIGAPLPQVAATQWASIVDTMLDDLARIPAENWTVTVFEEFLADPAGEIARLTDELGLGWEGEIPDPLPPSPTTVTDPAHHGWKHHAREVAALLRPRSMVVERLAETVRTKHPGFTWPELPEISADPQAPVTVPSEGTPFSSSYSATLPDLLGRARARVERNSRQFFQKSEESKRSPRFKLLAC